MSSSKCEVNKPFIICGSSEHKSWKWENYTIFEDSVESGKIDIKKRDTYVRSI